MNKKLVLLSVSALTAISTVVGVALTQKNGLSEIRADLEPSKCSHEHVEHYDATNTYFEAGHKEYWVCCECHSSFDHEPSANDTVVISNTTGLPTDTTDGRYAGKKTYIGLTDLCSYSNGNDGISEKAAPEGFEKVHKIKGTWASSINAGLNYMEFSQYKSFSFAVATKDGSGSFEFKDGEGNGLFDTNKSTWTIYEFKDEGNGYFQMYKNGSWVNIKLPLDGNFVDYKVKLGSDTFYITEVRGILKNKDGITSKFVKVADYPTTVFKGGTACTTESFDLGYGTGMSEVYEKTVAYNKTAMPTLALSKYTEVMFGIKAIDYSASNVAWVYMNDKTYIPEMEVQGNWFTCRIIRQEDNNWTITFGKSVYSDVTISNLNELVFKTGATKYAYTPLYAIEKEVEKPVYTKLDSYSFSTSATKNDYSLTDLQTVVPETDHSFTIQNSGGKYFTFDTLDISGYTRLYFGALAKSDTLNIYFPNGKNSTIGLNTPFKFMIDKVQNGVWTVTYLDKNGSMMSTTVGAPGDEINDLGAILSSNIKIQDWSSHGLRVSYLFATTFDKFVDEETKTSDMLGVCPLDLNTVGYGGRAHYEAHPDGYTTAYYEMIAKTTYALPNIDVSGYSQFYFDIDGSYNGQATTYIKVLDGNNGDAKLGEPGFGSSSKHQFALIKSGEVWRVYVDGSMKIDKISITNLNQLKLLSSYYNISIGSIFGA